LKRIYFTSKFAIISKPGNRVNTLFYTVFPRLKPIGNYTMLINLASPGTPRGKGIERDKLRGIHSVRLLSELRN
jgi:hypothetical protein